MTDIEIRTAMMNLTVRNRLRDLAISTGDDLLMMCISRGHDTASKIAARIESPLQSVSMRLNRLYNKGYLWRTQVPQTSGGYEWRYCNKYEVPEEKPPVKEALV